MIRSSQDSHESRRLLKKPPQVFSLVLKLFPREVLGGNVIAYDQYAGYIPLLTLNRHITICPPDIFECPITCNRDKPFFIPSRSFALHDIFDLWPDDAPDFCPTIATVLPQCARMALWPQRLAIRVVVELNQIWSVPDKHRMACI